MKLIENIFESLPPEIENFYCIKTQKIFIPYEELGIECLIHNISEINLFFESILELLSIGVYDIKEISAILGISEQIVVAVVSSMSIKDFVSVSENIIRITKKGKSALKSKSLSEIKKINLNKIFINLITGDITDNLSLICKQVKKYEVCLPEKFRVNLNFLNKNFSTINRIYQKQQKDYQLFTSNNKELYKIIDIGYSNLVYTQEDSYLYQSKSSEEFFIRFSNNQENYSKWLYENLNNDVVPPCLDNFFERNSSFFNKNDNLTTNISNMPDKLIQARSIFMNEIEPFSI